MLKENGLREFSQLSKSGLLYDHICAEFRDGTRDPRSQGIGSLKIFIEMQVIPVME